MDNGTSSNIWIASEQLVILIGRSDAIREVLEFMEESPRYKSSKWDRSLCPTLLRPLEMIMKLKVMKYL